MTLDVQDQKYTVDTLELRSRKQAEVLLKDDRMREVRQLKLVNDRNEFIVEELVNELFYKDLRNVYGHESQIANMEYIAHMNYKHALFDLPEGADPKQVFNETVKRPIPSSLIDDSPIYRHGCYIYLTGEEIDNRLQISWGHEQAKSSTVFDSERREL